MEQVRSLESLVNDVITEMERRGNADNTIVRHKRAYSQFCEYAQSKGQEYYSSDLTKAFLAEKEKLLPCRGPRFMEQYHIALNKLSDAAQGQELSLRHLQNGYHLELSRFDWVIPPFADRLNGRLKNANDVKVRLRILSMFLSFVEGQGVNELKAIRINHIAAAFEAATDKAHFCCVIREFLHFAADMEWMPTDLSYFVPKARRHKTVPTVYSTADIETCLSSIDRTTRSGRRTYAVLLICARLGLRNADVCELKFDNVDHSKKVISIIQKKTGVPLTLPLLPEVEDALNQYICVRPASSLPYIFLRHKAPHNPLCTTTVDYEFRKLLMQNSINTQGKKRGAHALRSSLASALLEEGVSYPVIQKTLGHSSPHATKYYTKIDITRLRDCALEVPMPSGNFAKLLGGNGDA